MEAKQAVAENRDRKYLAIARILRPQGRKGEVAAEILTDFPERFQALQTVYLETGSTPPKPARLERSWPHKGQIVLKLEGVDSIDSASGLRGSEILIPWEDRSPLPPDRYYLSELIGCRVVLERAGQEIGTVVEVEPTGGVDLLHVRRPDGKTEVLIPLAQEICKSIDPATQTIVINPPEELLGLND
jgi:16S rRNA processing protein RimM